MFAVEKCDHCCICSHNNTELYTGNMIFTQVLFFPSFSQILMSANWGHIHAILMLTVLTPMAVLTAHVEKALKETDLFAQVCNWDLLFTES